MRNLAKFMLFLIAVPAFTFAQGVEPEREEDRWSFGVGAYLFAASIKGVTTIGPKDIETDVSFNDLIDSVEAAYLVHFEALSPARRS